MGTRQKKFHKKCFKKCPSKKVPILRTQKSALKWKFTKKSAEKKCFKKFASKKSAKNSTNNSAKKVLCQKSAHLSAPKKR